MSEEKRPLAEENLGLVHLCANKFRGRGVEYEELYSAGCVGLLKAVKSFDTGRGVKFSTYAVPVILGEIKRVFRDGGMVKVSRSLKELSVKIQKIRENFMKENGREPLLSELSQLSGADISEVSEALCVSQPVVSLTAGNDEENQIDVPSEAESPDMQIVDILALRQIMSQMEETDKFLIELRYFKNLTQTETAKILGMTQVQVSRRERKILSCIREKLLE